MAQSSAEAWSRASILLSHGKLDAHYLVFVQIASVMVWLRSFGDTA